MHRHGPVRAKRESRRGAQLAPAPRRRHGHPVGRGELRRRPVVPVEQRGPAVRLDERRGVGVVRGRAVSPSPESTSAFDFQQRFGSLRNGCNFAKCRGCKLQFTPRNSSGISTRNCNRFF